MTETDRQQEIAEARRKLLQKRLKAKGKKADTPVISIEPKPDTAPALASLGQQRLWYIQQMQAKSTAYHMTNLTRIRGELDSTALEQGLQAITEQQAILRTDFMLEDGVLIQNIQAKIDLPFQQLSVTDEESALAEIHRFADLPFDLRQAPLWRALLVHVDEDTHYLMLVLHHIISDEWSIDVFWRKLARVYGADEKDLAPLDIQYVDYAHWQHQQIENNAYDAQLEYWREQLAGELPLLQLPTDRPRPAVQQFKGGLLEFRLDTELSDALQTMSKANNTTLFTTLLTAYQILLYRYTAQHDILIGTPVANRKLSQTEDLIGFFLNTIVLRADFTEDRSFNQHLRRMAQQTLKALAHQELPFDMLVDDLKPKRDPSYNPIFQTMFVYQDSSAHRPTLGTLQLEPIQIDANVAKFDLTLFARLDDEHIQLGIEYDTALFDSATVERLMTHYRTLLTSIVSAPDTAVSQLAILPETEREQLASFNTTRHEYPQDKLIHDLITAHPSNAIAIESKNGTLSYGELTARANYLAQELVNRGVVSDTPVGLCVERSPEMLIGILGILLAGGAYVPIDPNYPTERIRYVLADAGIEVLVTQNSLRDTLDYDGEVLLIGEDTQEHPPEISTTADNLAYLIYTSGSTGQPKGVRVTHRNLVHSTTARFAVYEYPVEKFLLLSSFAFDSSLVGIFWTLCQGGTLCLPAHEGEKDIQQVATLIREYGITHMLALPSLYQILLEFSEPQQLASLKTVIVAGEACTPALAELHHQQLSDTRLYNEYGPTEGTVWASVWQIPTHADKILIGQPIPNMQIHIVDEHMQTVPLGVIGELLIGGDGLAQGYHKRPTLTAERFVDNPFGEGKLYHTGDLGRYFADGTIEFIGRKDFQVKISGYRIELGEIETALLQADAVQEAVVIPITGSSSSKHPNLGNDSSTNKTRLSAFVTANDAVDEADLREHLRNYLPRYMIPSHITLLNDLPRTPNGKVDRRALENWQVTPTETAKAEPLVTAVEDEIEAQLIDLWEDLLSVDDISVHDDFFEIGGYSLLAVRMFASLNKMLNTDLPISTLMEAPTIAQLAQKVRSAEDESIDTIVTVRAEGDKKPLYVFQVNRFGIIHYQTLIQSLKRDRPVYGMVLAEEDEANMPSFVDLAKVYAQAIMKNQPEGPYYLMGLSVAGLAVYEVACILERETHSKAYAILFDTYGPDYPRIQPITTALPQKFGVFLKQFVQGSIEKKRFLLNDLLWQAHYRGSYWIRKFRARLGLPVAVDELQEFRVRDDAILHQLQRYFEEIQPADVEILLYRSQLQPIRAQYTETLHWDEVVPRENITVKPVSGAHTNLLRTGNVEVVSEHLQGWFEDKA